MTSVTPHRCNAFMTFEVDSGHDNTHCIYSAIWIVNDAFNFFK